VALLTVAFALAGGWIAGSPESPNRTAASLVTGIRANAPALAVAQAAFPGRPAVAVTAVVFGLVSVVVPLVVALMLRRRQDERPHYENGPGVTPRR
jgi:predicted Na+-dependent transporter